MNTDLRKKAKNKFEKYFLSWWIMQFWKKLWKMWENTEILNLSQKVRRKNYLVPEPTYHTTTKKTKQNKKNNPEILINNLVCLVLSILELSKILRYEFVVCIKTDKTYEDIAEDVENRSDTSNYELECNSINIILPKEKSKKVIGLMKDKLGRKIIKKFVGLRAKT